MSDLLFSLDIALLNGVSQYSCVAEFVGSKTIKLIQSIDRTQGNVTLWKFNENSWCILLPCYTASISMLFNSYWSFERRMAKTSLIQLLASFNNHEEACIMLCGKGRVRTQDLGYQSRAPWPLRCTPGSALIQSVLRYTTVHPQQWHNGHCTCRLPRHPQDGGYKRSTPASGHNIQVRIRRPDNIAVELWATGWCCKCSTRQLLASPVAANIIIKLLVLDQVFLVSATNGCFQIQARPQGCRRAGRAQAGTKQLHPT